VPRVLLLTDLHIGLPGMDAAGSDYSKSGIVPIGHQRLRQDVLRDTTTALVERGLVPDAVVIAGDVTYQDKDDGWQQLPEIMKPLLDAGLLPQHVVITPGNHDVTRNLPVDDPAHYTRFLDNIDKEWVRPLIEPDDIDDGQPRTTERRYLLLAEERLAIVPINSSHYCGVREPFEWLSQNDHDDLVSTLKSNGKEALAEAFAALKPRVEKLAEQDPIRISPNQLRALGEVSRKIHEDAQAKGIAPGDLTRVAVMHHPTLPVTVAEEVAAFESLTNLALVRLFLARSGFHILMHGHKHAGTVYTDRIAEFGQTSARREHPLLVVSGPTLSGEQGQTQAAAMLEIETSPLRRSVKLVAVPPVTALPPALPSRLPSSTFPLWEEDMRAIAPLVLSGRDVAETYDRLLAAFATPGEVRRNLMCIVERPENAGRIPPGYPENLPVNGAEGRQQWFSATVAWWQRPESKLLDTLHFSHGERLKSYRGTGDGPLDQIVQAVAALQADDTTTRAVLTLTDPARDKIATRRGFPAFVLLHAVLRKEPRGGVFLDLLGIFRKQEMRYWWPINVAEMALIQEQLLEDLNQPDVAPGRLITLSALAHAGDEVPAVNVALIDRLADEDADSSKIWAMAYSVAHPSDDADIRAMWEAVIEDLRPAPGGARVTASIVGLAELLKWLERLGNDPKVMAVKAGVRSLHETLNKVAADDLNDYWRETLNNATDAVRAAVEDALSVGLTSDTSPTIEEETPETPESRVNSAALDRPEDAQ
jgi:3',5'-cyclic AMP phosphodiesterase CpdA